MRSLSLLVAVTGAFLGAAVVAVLPSRTLFHAPHNEAAAESSTGERWACPMMDFIGNRPGDCPVCGMKMTKVTAGELTREQQRRMGVQLATVGSGPARPIVRAYGVVRYDDRTLQVVIPRVAGRVVKRHLAAGHLGTMVSEGDPVVDLYSPELFSAQGELAAAVNLGDQAAVEALSQRFARWNLPEVAKAIVLGGAPKDTVTIRSPFAGRVVLGVTPDSMNATLPQVGQEVMADTPLIRLVAPDTYILAIQVPEARAHWLAIGQEARIASDDKGELPEVQAKLAWLAPELNPDLRSREVHIHLSDPKGHLLPGSLVNARIETALDPDLHAANPADPKTWGVFTTVPKTAVLSTGVRNVAWRVTDRQPDGRLRFELAPLALGPRLEDDAGNDVFIVRAGLNPGDEVATQGAFLIDSQAQLAGTPSLLFPRGATAAEPAHQH